MPKDGPEGPVLPRLVNVGDGSQKRAENDLRQRQRISVYHLSRLDEIEPKPLPETIACIVYITNLGMIFEEVVLHSTIGEMHNL